MSLTWVVTGVTRGIGRALAEELCELGNVVHGCGRSEAALTELSGKYGDPHSFQRVDVTDAVAVERWAAQVSARGNPDVVVNNAGKINQLAPLWEVPPEEFAEVLQVNLVGVANVIRAFMPTLRSRGRGVFVQLSSGWGRSTAPGVAPYCATKWGIEGLNEALAQELPTGLAAVAVNPGTVHTEMLEIAFGAEGARQCTPADDWARRNAPRLGALGPQDNGRSITLA